jgi:polar amino acid transport system substrate-binding protein
VKLLIALTAWTIAAAPQAADHQAGRKQVGTLRVAVAGSEPFVVIDGGRLEGISVEIWQALAAEAGWRYALQTYENVPHALDALAAGKADLVVGPVSITAERAQSARFSQPYYQSSLSILSNEGKLSWWQRLEPFFNTAFYYAAGSLLAVLTAVGTLVWLAERKAPDSQFPKTPRRGIPNGIWFAVVTMSTVGYGDLAPKTRLGRAVTGVWILISVLAASSLVAAIGSTLTLTGLKRSTIETAEDLSRRRVAVMADSPGEEFARQYGARVHEVQSLEQGYHLLRDKAVDAVVFDRPQLLYFRQHHHDSHLIVSTAEYMRQNYGFALPLASQLAHPINVNLLELQEAGRVERIVRAWLGQTR